jgi:penicillin-binding protein 1A
MPKNSDGDYGTGEQMTLREAMAKSVNSITARVNQRVKEVNVVEFAHRVGMPRPIRASAH